MITKKTVFILGAGASVDFGYPIGENLRKAVYTKIKTNDSFVKKIAQALITSDGPPSEDEISYQKDRVVSFATELYDDGDYTIDGFLERFQKKYLTIGKLAIAEIIASYEDYNKLKDNDNWYRALYSKMKQNATVETFYQNQVSFVTFNYDRSLEHFLFTSLKAFHENISNNEEQVVNILNKIPIIHLYGQIDALPWQSSDLYEQRRYGKQSTPHQLNKYREKISIVYEKFSDNIQSKFNEARQLIDEAERVYILGFGFHEDNFKRLQLPTFKDKKIIGTGSGLDNDRISIISNYWGPVRKSDAPGIENVVFKGIDSLFFSKRLVLHNVHAHYFVKELAALD